MNLLCCHLSWGEQMKYNAGLIDEYEEGQLKSFRFDDKYSVCVVKQHTQFKAFRNACPHQFVPLSDGFLGENTITCCLHGWKFDLETGACDVAPKMVLPIYSTLIEDNTVFVIIEDEK